MKRCIFLIIDGLGDLPVAALNGLTPLEAAHTPHFDWLASTGYFGLVDPIKAGIIPNTDSGTGLLMGMLPSEVNKLRRGTIEAAGVGRVLQEGEVALRANFATAVSGSEPLLVQDRRAGRVRHGLEEMAGELNGMDLGDGLQAEFIITEQHRAVLVLAGGELDARVSDTDPGDAVLPAPLQWSKPMTGEAGPCARALNRFIRASHEILRDHPLNSIRGGQGKKPANMIITRGAGSAVDVQNQFSAHGVSAAVISGCNTVRGLGRMLGFELIDHPAFTADLDTDLDGKIQAALETLNRHNLAFVQIKAADVCAHDRDAAAKRDFIERIDTAILPLLEHDVIVALASDHTTDSNTGHHSGDPIPAFISTGTGAAPDTSTGGKLNFGESSCRNGNMLRQNSESFTRRVLDCIGERP